MSNYPYSGTSYLNAAGWPTPLMRGASGQSGTLPCVVWSSGEQCHSCGQMISWDGRCRCSER